MVVDNVCSLSERNVPMSQSQVLSPAVQAVVKAGQRDFLLEIRREGHASPLLSSELREIVQYMSGFVHDPLTRDLECARRMSNNMGKAAGIVYLLGAYAVINKRYQNDELVGMRNSPYHLSFRDSADRWHHYQAYEVS